MQSSWTGESANKPREIVAAGAPLTGPTLMTQWWRDITFLHWRIAPDLVAPHLPTGVRPDEFDGSSWVGLIPFRMVGAGVGAGPAVRWLGTFWETNVRVYTVDRAGRRGVSFLSLEAERAVVVLGARLAFAVPYFWARMSGSVGAGQGHYTTHRLLPHRPRPRSTLRVEIGEEITVPDPLSLFLTARFGLHTSVLGRPVWVPNTHGPWPLHRARLTDLSDQLVAATGLPDLPAQRAPDSVLWSPGVRTTFGMPRRV